MADPVTVSRLGQENGTGDDRKLFKDKAQTDILKYFKLTAIARSLVTVKSMENGKSISFPVIGNVEADYHTVGKQLDGEKILHSERTIAIDDLLVAHAYIDDLDEAMANYDSKAAYNEAIGRSLGKKYEQDLLRTIVKAAAISTSMDAAAYGLPAFDDQVYTSPVTIASADVLKGFSVYQAILSAKTEWFAAENIGDPVVILQPEQYSALLANPASTGTTWVDDEASQSGKVPMVSGCKVYQTPYLPKATVVASAKIKGKYAGKFSGTIGVLLSQNAVGAAELLTMSIRLDYVPDRLSDLMVGKMAVGFGVLNPASAILIATAGSDVLNLYNASVVSISVDPSAVTLDISDGDTAILAVTALLSNGQSVSVTEFTAVSSDPAKASVAGGVVTPLAAGESTVTVSYSGKTATCVVTVEE